MGVTGWWKEHLVFYSIPHTTFKKNKQTEQKRWIWCRTLIPTPRRQRQADLDCEFKASLVSKTSSRTGLTHRETRSQRKKKKTKKKPNHTKNKEQF